MTSHERVREPIEILIKTKLQIPPVKSRLIRRDRLIDRLEAGKNRKVFLVMGLAGSGKTSLVRQWIAQLETPVAWYSLDKTDNEQDTFLRYLAEAMSSLHDTLASALEPCREGQQGLSAGQVLPLLIRTLSSLEDDYYLVLDDYHMVTSPEVHDCVSYLFHHMPHNMHVVIATRHAIPFPLSRYRVRNDLVEISSVDLTFTETETKEFFEETFGIELTTGQAQSLTDRMEGWVGGLQLMGLVSGRPWRMGPHQNSRHLSPRDNGLSCRRGPQHHSGKDERFHSCHYPSRTVQYGTLPGNNRFRRCRDNA